MKQYIRKLYRLILGVFLASLGVFFCVQANIGLAPWDAFAIGITNVTHITIGTANIIIAVVTLLAAMLMKEKIGVGAIANTFLVGLFLDLFYFVGLFPESQTYWLGIPMLFFGLFLIGLGAYFYIGSGLGAGPRDALAIALGKRLKLPVGSARGVMDLAVLFFGWLLGAKIGVGTVLSAFCLGPILQLVCKAFKLDIKAVVHEDLAETWRGLIASVKK